MYGAKNLGNSGKEILSAIDLVQNVAQELKYPWSGEGMEFVEKAKKW